MYVTCTCTFYILYVYPVCVYMMYAYIHDNVRWKERKKERKKDT